MLDFRAESFHRFVTMPVYRRPLLTLCASTLLPGLRASNHAELAGYTVCRPSTHVTIDRDEAASLPRNSCALTPARHAASKSSHKGL